MTTVLQTLTLVFDPRGRCNRKGLLVLMLVTLFLQSGFGALVFGLGLALNGPVALVIKLTFVWVAISATVQRLHDIGKSGWWLLAAITGLIVWIALWGGVVPLAVAMNYGVEHVRLFSPLFYVFVVISYLPVIAGALWLHFRKGEDVANRFGPVPNGTGFARCQRPEPVRSHTSDALPA